MQPTNSHTIVDFYNNYSQQIKKESVYDVTYEQYKKVVIDYFKFLRDELIENGKELKLPYRLGRLSIIKRKPKVLERKSLRIDFAATRQYDKIIYHLNEHSDGYKYRFYWNKHDCNVMNKTKYELVMTRYNKRRLAVIIKGGIRDYPELI